MTHGAGTAHQAKTGVRWWVGQVLSWVLLLAVLVLVCAMVVVPQVLGSGSYTVLTGSMRPTMPPGSLVVTKPVTPSDLRIGDVITYQMRSGEPDVVTHRIVAVSQSSGGGTTFTTKGDANDEIDERPVQPAQVRGVVWYSLPLLGYVNGWLTGGQRTWVLFGSVTVLLAYTAYMFLSAGLGAVRARRRTRTADDDERTSRP